MTGYRSVSSQASAACPVGGVTPIASLTMIDVVMACFNTDEPLLRQAVASVASQRAELAGVDVVLRLFIVDDASSYPSTLSALTDLERTLDWVTVIRLSTNLGPAGSRNEALKATDAPWISFLDSDDYWLDGGLSALVFAQAAHPSSEWISGDFFLHFEDEPMRQPDTFYRTQPARGRYLKSALDSGQALVLERPFEPFLEGSLCSMGSCIISRALLDRVGLFDVNLRKGVDTELYWRLTRTADLLFVPVPVFVYRRRKDSVSGDGRYLGSWEPEVLERMLSDDAWSDHHPPIRRRLLRTLLNLSQNAVLRDERRKARRFALRAVKLKPLGLRPWVNLVRVVTSRSGPC